jgi:peptidyl-prolyl cis-trans isomerase B (cyclophilin B)
MATFTVTMLAQRIHPVTDCAHSLGGRGMRSTSATACLVVTLVGLLATTGAALGHPVSAPAGTTAGPCAYTATPDDPSPRPVSLPPDPTPTPDKGIVRVLLATNRGPLPLSLDRAKAPCAVQSFLYLTRSRFYDFSPCHRLTRYPTLQVLQCGDPTGTGERGPGYRYKDELPTDLRTGPGTGSARIYARGTVAMANAGPDTNGSQFFLVIADSELRPEYSVLGTVDRTGLNTLDRVAAGGITPTAEDPAPLDGSPARRTSILVARSLGDW